MQEGALGIGTALIYPPGRFARTAELTALCEVVGRHDGVYISHLRSEGDTFLECLEELIGIGRDAGCRTEAYHLKAVGRHNWHKMRLAIERIEKARADGQPVTANMYPYTAGGTALAASVPPRFHVGGPAVYRERLEDPAQRAEMAAALREHSADFENLFLACGPEGIFFPDDLDDGTAASGRTLAQLTDDLGLGDPAAALVEISRRSPSSSVLYFMADEANVELGLSQPWVSLGSDAEALTLGGGALSGHPRAYGTFARFLGHYVRDRGVTSLPDAVRRMTSARSVAGRPGLGMQRRRMSAWKNSETDCWTVVTVFPAVRSSPFSAPCRRPCQNGSACGCRRRISIGWVAAVGLATHCSTSSSVLPVSAAAWK